MTKRKPICVIPHEPDQPVDGIAWGVAIGTALVCGPFALALSLFGCAAAVKAARLLFDVVRGAA